MSKVKLIVMAFSGWFIYAALLISINAMTSDALICKLVAGLIFVVFGCAYTNIVLGRFGTKVALDKGFLIKSLISIVFFSMTALLTSAFIVNLINDKSFIQKNVEFDSLSTNMKVLSTLISIFLAPVVEEFIFRGCMYRFLSELNKPFAFIISSLVFAIMHGTLTHLYIAFLGGLLLCCIYEKTRRLWLSMVAHSLYNLLAVILSCCINVKYQSFGLEVMMIIFLNIMMIAALVKLFKHKPEYDASAAPKVLSDMQQKEHLETQKIVNAVLDNYKK